MNNKNRIGLLIAFLFVLPKLVSAIPNPAAVYCSDNGGTWTPGAQGYALCEFKDGSECEEWSYFDKKCSPGQIPKGGWVAMQSKDPDFTIFIQQAGWVTDTHSVNYVDQKDAKYFYYHVAVENSNLFSGVSTPTTLVAYTDPTQTFFIPQLGPGDKSPYFNIYIPITKTQRVDLAVNPNRSVKESNYDNNTAYNRPSLGTAVPEKQNSEAPISEPQKTNTAGEIPITTSQNKLGIPGSIEIVLGLLLITVLFLVFRKNKS